MRRTVLMSSVIFAVGIAIGVLGAQVLSAQQEAIKRTVLLKTDLAGIEGKEGVIIRVELAAGAAAGKHYHPGHELVYILQGSGTFEAEGKPPRAVKAGDTLYVTPKLIHDVKNTGKTPVKALVVAIAEKGQPLTVPVK